MLRRIRKWFDHMFTPLGKIVFGSVVVITVLLILMVVWGLLKYKL